MSKKEIKPEVTIKNTKERILSAYNDALSLLNAKELDDIQNKKQVFQEKDLIKNISSQKNEDVFKQVGDLKVGIIKQLDALSEKLILQQDKFEKLQYAIKIEQDHLENLYDIKDSTNALSALSLAQQKEKEQFINEMEQIKKNWLTEKLKLDNDYKEHRDNIDTKRRREEEYKYQLNINRRKELDDYHTKKIIQEQALQNKENELNKLEEALLTREKFLNELEMQVQNISVQLDAIEKQTETNATKILKERFEHEKQLHQQKYDAALKLQEQSINYLKSQIEVQEKDIIELKNKLTSASDKVQNIASKALETSVKRIFINDDEKHSKATN